MTKQEMFNKAYLGLKSQNFEQCYFDGMCRYADGAKRCAWGWVDLSLKDTQDGTVCYLNEEGIGLAKDLVRDDLTFARDLQRAHDGGEPFSWRNTTNRLTAYNPEAMQANLAELAEHYGLSIPE